MLGPFRETILGFLKVMEINSAHKSFDHVMGWRRSKFSIISGTEFTKVLQAIRVRSYFISEPVSEWCARRREVVLNSQPLRI